MPEIGKTAISKRLTEQGYSSSYSALLCLTAQLGPDPLGLDPRASEEELSEWRGHFKGLRAALLCIAIHERRLDPELAADVVAEQIEYATDVLRRVGNAEAGG